MSVQKTILIAIIVAILAILATTKGASAAPIYTWTLVDSNYGLVPRGTLSVLVPQNTADNMYLHQLYGRWTFFQTQFTCNAEYCAEGVFTFARNPHVYSTGSGLNMSPDVVFEYDPGPVNAFNMSGIVLQAQVAGILEEPIIKGLFLSLFGIMFGRMMFKATFTIIGLTRDHFDNEGTEGKTQGSGETAIELDSEQGAE
jgi:hypothetical protein